MPLTSKLLIFTCSIVFAEASKLQPFPSDLRSDQIFSWGGEKKKNHMQVPCMYNSPVFKGWEKHVFPHRGKMLSHALGKKWRHFGTEMQL